MSGIKVITKHQSIVQHDIITSMNQEVVEWHLQPYSSLVLTHEYMYPSGNYTQHIKFFLDQGSSLYYFPLLLEGTHIDFSLSLLLGKESNAQVNGVYALNAQDNYLIKTVQQHKGTNSMSRLVFNGLAADQSLIHYTGLIAVDKTASQSNASQENKTILFGHSARAISVPALEVQTNDVHCAHGSAVGPLSNELIYYAQSRGMDFKRAQKLLLTSFLSQTLSVLPNERLKTSIINTVINKVLKKDL